ncbi:glucosaminidase domain-containing protein [Anaerococcus sp. DFU013_CI05]|uniref:glucosaminidase domain-containing protein n=1 Tax=Anaerococcus sp. AH8042_DFU013_CI05 TaxID=3385202 RepID=UPI003A522182
MKNKKMTRIFGLVSLMFSLNLFIVDTASASKDQTKSNLLDGLNKINYETTLLKKTRAEQYKKLKDDMDEFYDKGSSKIDSKNMFYCLNVPDFTEEEYETGLKDTGLAGLGKDFKNAGDTYGVNPILLMAMAKHETGNGTSELFLNKNNLFGYNAIDIDPYNKATNFKTPAESINTVAKHLKENYLSSNGAYYKGVSTDAIGMSYATDPDWSKKVNWMMIEVVKSMIEDFENETGM